MAIAKGIRANDLLNDEDDEASVDVEIDDEGDPDFEETGDGGGIVTLQPSKKPTVLPDEHEANLAEHLSDSELDRLGLELADDFEIDLNSRSDWERIYLDGLKLTGMRPEHRKEPWDGASGVFHPLITEAQVAFQSNAILELVPPTGPVGVKIMGPETPEAIQQAERVRHDMNHIIMDIMTEWRNEMEVMLWRMPLGGCGVKMIYFDQELGRQTSKFIPVEDFVVQYGTTSLQTSPRYSHREYLFKTQVDKLISSGFYRDVNLSDPVQYRSDIQEAHDDITGDEAPVDMEDGRYEIITMTTERVIPGIGDGDAPRPYTITFERQSGKILSIRRNWREDDESGRKKVFYVQYPFLPGLGWYGTGYIHLLGGLAEAATSLTRQLIDAGTLSNIPAGFKTREFRVKGDDTPIAPGEFRDVDISGATLKDSLVFLPYKEPSQVLLALLGDVVSEGRRIGSVADMKIAEVQGQTPVGTTLAILERAMRVMSSIHARLHAALKQELEMLAELIQEYMPDKYEWDEQGQFSRKADYGSVQIIPVSDPTSATTSQRVVQYQALIANAATAPDVYDRGFLHREAARAMGMKNADKLVPIKDDIRPTDPVTENMNLMAGTPVKAFLYQDHEAHIQVHMAAYNDPKIQAIMGQNPQAPIILGAFHAHVAEHLGMAYRQKIEKELGIPLPPPGEPLPEDLEVSLSQMVAQAADQVLQKNLQEAQMQQMMQEMQDPVHQIEMRDQDIKQQKVQNDYEIQKERNQIEAAKVNVTEKTAGADQSAKVLDAITKRESELAKRQQESAMAAQKMEMDRQDREARRNMDLQDRVSDRIQSVQERDEERRIDAAQRERDREIEKEEAEKDRKHKLTIEKLKARSKPKPAGGGKK